MFSKAGVGCFRELSAKFISELVEGWSFGACLENNTSVAPHRRQASKAVSESQPSLWGSGLATNKRAGLPIRPHWAYVCKAIMPSHLIIPWQQAGSPHTKSFLWEVLLSGPNLWMQKYCLILILLQNIYLSNPTTGLWLSLMWLLCYRWIIMVQHNEDLSLNCMWIPSKLQIEGQDSALCCFCFCYDNKLPEALNFKKKKKKGK